MQILTLLVSSALISAIVSGVVAGLFSLHALQTQYRNEYYKRVLENRIIEAYARLERLIGLFKTSVADYDNRLYHLVFVDGGDKLLIHRSIIEIQSVALWISDEAFEASRELNLLMFSLPEDAEKTKAFAKDRYQMIATAREKLERVVSNDMLTLYNVPQFLKVKGRRTRGFEFVNLPTQTPNIQATP
ncbi:MAG TPA: hypothetical protein VG960_00540 [Caulobacteraceae bacterium]|nr:hypothetical protein [Caulobacteraceae bacterium]